MEKLAPRWRAVSCGLIAASLSFACRAQDAGLNPTPDRPGDAGFSDLGVESHPNDPDHTGAVDANGVIVDAAVPPAIDTGVPGDPPACVPGALRCAIGAPVVEICVEGGAWKVHETCASICMSGACVGACRPGDRRCGANQTPDLCSAQGQWAPQTPCPMICAAAGTCVTCAPGARRCDAAGAAVEECTKDGAGYASVQACGDGCQAAKCNQCRPGATTCTGTTLRTCRDNGNGWSEQVCKAPPGGGGTAVCAVDGCDVTCEPGRVKMGQKCVCPGDTVECGGACVPASETIDVPMFDKACALPFGETCDPYEFPIMIQGCAKRVEVTLQAAATHCAPIFLQMLVNGTPKGPRSAAIPAGQSSVPLNLGALGPGPVTLGFVATIDRSGCGLAGLLTGWAGSAKITTTVR
jgi:hypothetical protein